MGKSKKKGNKNTNVTVPVGGITIQHVENKKRNKNQESQPTKSDKKDMDKTRKEENNVEKKGDSSHPIKIENGAFEEKTNCSDNLQSEIKQYCSVDNESTFQTILNVSNNENSPNLIQQKESDFTKSSNYGKKSGEEFTYRSNMNKGYRNNRSNRNDKDNSYRKDQYRTEDYNTSERNLEKEHDNSGRNANFQNAWGNTRNNRSLHNEKDSSLNSSHHQRHMHKQKDKNLQREQYLYDAQNREDENKYDSASDDFNVDKRVDSGKVRNNYDDGTVRRTNAGTKKDRRDNDWQRNVVSNNSKGNTDSTKNNNWSPWENANVSKSEDSEPSNEDANQLSEECQNKMQLNQDLTGNYSLNESEWQSSSWRNSRSSRERGSDFKSQDVCLTMTDSGTKGNRKDKNSQRSMTVNKRKENDNWSTRKDNNVSNPENTEQPYEEPNKWSKMRSHRGGSSGDDSFNQNRSQNFSTEKKRSIRGRSYLENEDEQDKTPDKYHNKSFNQGQYRFLERAIEDKNFHQWLQKNPEINYKHIEETEGDLFKSSEESSLAHCVAEDMGMGSGIAVTFRQQFKRVDQLLDQRQRSGGLAILEEKGRFVYYLVTKRNSSGKPTLTTLWSSLRKLRDHMHEHKVSQLSIPRIGCGLDRLEWQEVKPMIEYMFLDTDVSVTVYNLPKQVIEGTSLRIRNCKVVNVEHPVVDIEEYTIIIYLCSEKGEVTKEIEELDKKFNILPSYRNAVKRRGEVIRNVKGSYILYGCVVKKEIHDEISFVHFQKCIQTLKTDNKKDFFNYVAIEAFEDERDDIIMKKIINILRNTLIKVDVYVCWPKGIPTDTFQE